MNADDHPHPAQFVHDSSYDIEPRTELTVSGDEVIAPEVKRVEARRDNSQDTIRLAIFHANTSGVSQHVYQTHSGWAVDANPPPGGQAHFKLSPEGRVSKITRDIRADRTEEAHVGHLPRGAEVEGQPGRAGAAAAGGRTVTASDHLKPMQFRIKPGSGDAVPGGYNGSLIAEHKGRQIGSLEYQTARGEPGFKIAMVKVHPDYQGQDIGSHLLMAARREMPTGRVNPGMMTDQGYKWWQRRGRSIAKHYQGEWNPGGYEVTTRPRAHRDVPEPEIGADMAATDHLHPVWFYHGTRSAFEPSQLLTPQGEGSANFLADSDEAPGQHVYYDTDRDTAEMFGYHAYGPGSARVYQVEPAGPHEPDPHAGFTSYRSAHPVRVIREAGIDEAGTGRIRWADPGRERGQ